MGRAGEAGMPTHSMRDGGKWRRRRVAVVLSIAAAALVLGVAPAADARAVVAVQAGDDPADVLEYWTPARMLAADSIAVTPHRQPGASAAVPPDGKPSSVAGSRPGGAAKPRIIGGVPAGGEKRAEASGHIPFAISQVGETTTYPERTHGKLFATFPAFGDAECSATVVPGNTASTLITAGHCVYETGVGFASNVMFVPGYVDGAAPNGAWAAKRLVVAKPYRADSADVSVDVGAIELAADETGRRIEDVIGSRGIAFNQPRKQDVDAYGYPGEPVPGLQFNGGRLWRCDTRYGGKDPATAGLVGPRTQWIGCPMTGGSSGGGWVYGETTEGSGFVESVISYGYPEEPNHLYGPYFSRDARKVWIAGQDSCKGKLATHVGTESAERIVGTPGNDVVVAKGGRDVVNGRGGDDRICGGEGSDKLRGKGGRDKLAGGAGRDALAGGGGGDRMDGGPGRDRCGGGSGRDSAKRCERAHGIP